MTEEITYQTLQNIALLKDVSHSTLAEMARTCTWVHLEKDEVLFKQGDPSENLFLVYEGRIRIVREYEEERITVAVLSEGQVTGELSMIIGEPRTATVEAVLPSHLVRLDRDTFFTHMGKDPGMASRMLIELGQRLQNTTVMLRETALNNAHARLASMVLSLAEDGQGGYKTGLITENFRPPRLARSIGIKPEVINEVLQEWIYEGYIGMNRRRFFLHEVHPLREIAGLD